MTGQKYSKNKILFHDFSNVFKNSFWIFIVLLGMYLVLIPFSTAGIPGQTIFDIEVTHSQLRFRFINDSFLFGTYCVAVLSGIFTALYLFKFLRNKRETTIFMSLGMTRWHLFIVRALVGVLMVVFAVSIPMTVSFLLNKYALGTYAGITQRWLYITTGLILVSLVSYFVTIMSCAVSGTLSESVLFGSTLLLTMTGLLYGLNVLVNKLVWGGARGIFTYSGSPLRKQSFVDVFRKINPITFFYDELVLHNKFLRSSSMEYPVPVSNSVLWLWFCIVILLAGLSYILIKNRKAEITGMTGGCHVLSEIVIALSAFMAAIAVFEFFYEMLPVQAFISAAVVFVIVHFIWRRTLFNYEMKISHKLVTCGGELLIAAVIVVFLMTDRFGSTIRFLDKTEVISARISYVGSPNYFAEPVNGSSNANGFYMQGDVTVSDPAEILKVKEIHKEIQKIGKHKKQLNTEEFSKTVVPYDIQFSYIDNFGKEHLWYYDRASLEELSMLLSVDDFNSVRKNAKRVVNGTLNTDTSIWSEDAYKYGDVYIADSRYATKKILDLNKNEREQLLSCIGEDVLMQSVDDRYYPTSEDECILMFSRTGDVDKEEFKYHMNNTFVHVTDSFTNTIEFLTSRKLMPRNDYEIESIALQRFNPYENINGLRNPMSMYFMSYWAEDLENFIILKDFGTKYTVTGKEEIRQLSNGLRNTYFMDEGGYLAAVKIKDVDGYSFQFIPESMVPSFVVD